MLDRTTKGVSSKPRMSLEVDDPLLLTEPPTRIADLRTSLRWDENLNRCLSPRERRLAQDRTRRWY